jgi:hypothetical protein
MTLSTTPDIEFFTGDGSNKVFSPGFVILLANTIEVYLGGVLQTLTTHYAVSNITSSGFDVTFVTEPGASVGVAIRRTRNVDQQTDYIPNSAFGAQTHELALDKLTMLVQRLSTEMLRCVRAPIYEDESAFGFADKADRADMLLGFDGSGDLEVTAKGAVTTTLNALGDVNAGAPGDTDVLAYDSASGKWINSATGGSQLLLIDTQALSGASAAEFKTGIDGSANRYVFVLDEIVVSNDGARFELRTSTDGGGSYDTGASDYKHTQWWVSSGATSGAVGDQADTSLLLSTIGNAAGESYNATIEMSAPSNAALFTTFGWREFYTAASGNIVTTIGAGQRLAAADVDAVKFSISAGTFSGKISLYKLVP